MAAADKDAALLLVKSALGAAVRAGLGDGQWRALGEDLDGVVDGMGGGDELRCVVVVNKGVLLFGTVWCWGH